MIELLLLAILITLLGAWPLVLPLAALGFALYFLVGCAAGLCHLAGWIARQLAPKPAPRVDDPNAWPFEEPPRAA